MTKNRTENPRYEGSEHDEILWGAAAIGGAISLTERQTRHLLDRGLISCAFKLGGRWAVRRAALGGMIRDLEAGDLSVPKKSAHKVSP